MSEIIWLRKGARIKTLMGNVGEVLETVRIKQKFSLTNTESQERTRGIFSQNWNLKP